MIADSIRTDAFAGALRQVVTQESVVLDVGTGTGIFALLAYQLGARKIYAIEPNNSIQVAREMAAANGYSDRVEFIQNLSTKITLPERADVAVSDLRGLLPFFQHHIPAILDARKRLLAPNGVLIPQRDTLWAAVVETPEFYSRHYTAPWNKNNYGLDMSRAQKIVTNAFRKVRIEPEQVLVDPQCWATLDYSTIESPDVRTILHWTVECSRIAHGFIAWFDATLAEGIYFSNAPGKPELIYGNTFFPFSKPVSLKSGDTISISLEAKLVVDDYIWRWNTLVLHQGDPAKVKADFKQSTFFGAPLSLSNLHKQASTHMPSLDEDGQVIRFVLSQMDGTTSLGDIAHQLSQQFPAQFPTWEKALDRVSELSRKYSR